MSKNDVELKIDWATHAAAKYACEHWHYSGSLPVGKLVKIGAWEEGKFIGVVLFGRGANNNIGKSYNLNQTQCCELVRVALTHHDTTVTKIVAIAIRFLKSQSPSMRLIVSYADPLQGHYGGIYQAGNWVYVGVTKGGTAQLVMSNGKIIHKRTAKSIYGTCSSLALGATWTEERQKHKYLMPLDKKMRKQILRLAQPYPKKTCPVGVTGNTSDYQSEDGGSTPTAGLISTEV